MTFFERLFDLCGAFFGGLFGLGDRMITSIFGSANARTVSKLQTRAESITELEPKYQAMSDDELRGQTAVSYTHLRAHRDLSTSRMPSSA